MAIRRPEPGEKLISRQIGARSAELLQSSLISRTADRAGLCTAILGPGLTAPARCYGEDDQATDSNDGTNSGPISAVNCIMGDPRPHNPAVHNM